MAKAIKVISGIYKTEATPDHAGSALINQTEARAAGLTDCEMYVLTLMACKRSTKKVASDLGWSVNRIEELILSSNYKIKHFRQMMA